ncbi:MAG TPA: hypothetical protein VGX26_06770, partial [Solirubrobacteraceae bacterium]|nr:hypothetical protein [Solirubrobacteraceae bacterium]
MSRLILTPEAFSEPAIRTIGKGSIVRGAGGDGGNVVVRGWLDGGAVGGGDCVDGAATVGAVTVNVAA